MEKKIVLAIDDMSENLTAIKAILQDYYDVRLSKSAKMALEVFKNGPVDLILLDLEMPGMTGFIFLKTLRQDFPVFFKEIPVIMVTAHASTDVIIQAIKLGVKDYIVKPIQSEVLLKKISARIGLPEPQPVSKEENEESNNSYS